MPLPIPKFIKTAFANIGLRNNIPEITNNTTGAAGYDRGFGEINMLPEGAGGIPPDGKDFNGIFFDISSAIRYLQSGVALPFNQDFATAIGGYEIGAIVSDESNKSLLWINGTASNTVFPTGWQKFTLEQATETLRSVLRVGTQAEVNAGTRDDVVVTPKKFVDAFKGSAGSLSPNGYQKLPSGLIIQWGKILISAGGSGIALTFPMAFPSSVYSFVASATQTSTSITSAWFDLLTASGAQVRTNGINPTSVSWIAIGK